MGKQACSCEFHVRGFEFDVEGFLKATTLNPFWTHHKGDYSEPGTTWPYSGLSLSITEKESFNEQLTAAHEFLSRHKSDLRLLDEYAGKYRLISFCTAPPPSLAEHDRLPHEFLAICGELSISLDLSHPPATE